MKIEEIKDGIREMQISAKALADECFNLYKETDNPHMKSVANFLQYELTHVANRLGELDETETEMGNATTDTDSDDEETIEDWWYDLDLVQKCDVANIPYPTCDYGRGDEHIETEDRAQKWWDSRTIEQKREIYEDTLAWWDCE